MPSVIDKDGIYADLVAARRTCRRCAGLANPATVAGGAHDLPEIGPWTGWQGNLGASIVLVGQDYSDVAYFERQQGIEDATNRTNLTLVTLFKSIGIELTPPGQRRGRGEVFFTNAILCLKSGGMQSKVRSEWFANCAEQFLRAQIELVAPRVVIGLGSRAYGATLRAFGLQPESLSEAVQSPGRLLPNGSTAIAVYHCGARVVNGVRPLAQQLEDWARVRRLIEPEPQAA